MPLFGTPAPTETCSREALPLDRVTFGLDGVDVVSTLLVLGAGLLEAGLAAAFRGARFFGAAFVAGADFAAAGFAAADLTAGVCAALA